MIEMEKHNSAQEIQTPQKRLELKQVLHRLKPHFDRNPNIPFVVTASQLGDTEALKVLHKNGFDVNKATDGSNTNDEKRTAIFYAVLNNDIKTAEVLLSLGANVNMTDSVTHWWYVWDVLHTETIDRTPLEYAVSKTKNLEMVKLLIEKGNADIGSGLRKEYLEKSTPEIIEYIQNAKRQKQNEAIAKGKKHPANQPHVPTHEME